MKSFAIAALALLSAASAAPLNTRQTSTEFDVTGLNIGCVPHSSMCYFNLNVAVSPAKSVVCGATALSYQVIPSLPPTACDDNSVSFSYTLVEGGANLEVNWEYEAGRNLTGTRFVPASDIEWTNTQSPTGTVQAYMGPRDFVIVDLQAVAVL